MSRHMTIAYVSRDLFLLFDKIQWALSLNYRVDQSVDQIRLFTGCSQPVMSKQIERQLIVFDFDW